MIRLKNNVPGACYVNTGRNTLVLRIVFAVSLGVLSVCSGAMVWAQAKPGKGLTPLNVTLPVDREAVDNLAQAKQWLEQTRYDEALASLSEVRRAPNAMTPEGKDRFIPLATAVASMEDALPESAQGLRRLVNRRDGVSDQPEAAKSGTGHQFKPAVVTSTISDKQWGESWVGAWRIMWKGDQALLPQASSSKKKSLSTDAQWVQSGYPTTRGLLLGDQVVVGTSSTVLPLNLSAGEAGVTFPIDKHYARTTWRNYLNVGGLGALAGLTIHTTQTSPANQWHFAEQLGKALQHDGKHLYRIERNLPAVLSAGKFKSGKEKINLGKIRSEISKRFGQGWITNRLCAYDASTGKRLWVVSSPEAIDHPDFGLRVISEPLPYDDGVLVVVHNAIGLSLRQYDAEGKERFRIALGEVFPGTLRREIPCALAMAGHHAYIMPGVGAIYKVDLSRRSIAEVLRYPHYPMAQQAAPLGKTKSKPQDTVHLSHGFMIHQDQLLCLPVDSKSMMAIDVDRSAMNVAWHMPRQGIKAMYALGKRIVTTDKRHIRVWDMTTGKRIAQYDAARITGLGTQLNNTELIFPSIQGLVRCDVKGNQTPRFRVSTVARPVDSKTSPLIGNLLSYQDRLLAVGPGWVECLMPQTAILAQWERAWKNEPGLALLNKKALLGLSLNQSAQATMALAAFKRVDGELSNPSNEAWVNAYLNTLISRKQAEVAGQSSKAQALKQAGFLFRHEIKLYIARLSASVPKEQQGNQDGGNKGAQP